jgi:catechol 2,3-dioxygenase-like lactoylglutathione lyase family enzyme
MNTHLPTAEGSALLRNQSSNADFNPSWVSVAALACLAALFTALVSLRGAAQVARPCDHSQIEVRSTSQPIGGFITTVGFTVSDMDRALDFYAKILSFEKISDLEVAGETYERLEGLFGLRMRVCQLRLGDDIIELTEYLAPSTGRAIPPDSRSNDRWFQHIAIIVSDMDRAYAQLRAYKVKHASTEPQTIPSWNVNAGGIRAFYFKDPDNHVLEILWFPPDKGAAKWHAPTDKLFLGIDHTAIVVADTDESLKFYRDTLGMIVAGSAENHGAEQEHLNNVFGARLRITSLRFPDMAGHRGPAIELLEYLAPRDGEPFPVDSQSNDLWHWQITIDCADSTAAAESLGAARAAWISPGPIQLASPALGFTEGLSVRDPDGHALRLVRNTLSGQM